MTMFNPPHPGSILKKDIFPELDITDTEAANSWLSMQTDYDLWQARQNPIPNIKHVKRTLAA